MATAILVIIAALLLTAGGFMAVKVFDGEEQLPVAQQESEDNMPPQDNPTGKFEIVEVDKELPTEKKEVATQLPSALTESVSDIPASVRELFEGISKPRPEADKYISKYTLDILPPDAEIVPPGSTFEIEEGTWEQIGSVGRVVVVARSPGLATERMLVVLGLEGGEWKLSSTVILNE